MGKVHCRDPRTGVVYVYSSEGFFDEKDQKYKYRRRVIGKLDENGNEIPTGPKGRPRKPGAQGVGSSSSATGGASLGDQAYQEALDRIQDLEKRNMELQGELIAKTDALKDLRKETERSLRQISDALDGLKKALDSLS